MNQTSWRFNIYSKFWKLIDNVFPSACIGCGKAGAYFCSECMQKISPIKYEKLNLSKDDSTFFTTRAYSYHVGLMREAVHKLKYENDIGLGMVLAKELKNIVEDNEWKIDCIVPIPLGKKRKRERGYNQAEVIAYPLSNYLGLELNNKLITRCKETRTQIGLTVKERIENMAQAFVLRNGEADGKSILLIDDVYTSGATMKSAARTLKDAGAKRVYSLTVTRANEFSAQEIW